MEKCKVLYTNNPTNLLDTQSQFSDTFLLEGALPLTLYFTVQDIFINSSAYTA
jgi:hypothetical protein